MLGRLQLLARLWPAAFSVLSLLSYTNNTKNKPETIIWTFSV